MVRSEPCEEEVIRGIEAAGLDVSAVVQQASNVFPQVCRLINCTSAGSRHQFGDFWDMCNELCIEILE